MKSLLAEEFWPFWRCLPQNVRSLARENYQLWRADPKHRSLRFKQVLPGLWSVRVGRNYRALGRQRGDEVHWFWIGPHGEYDALLRRL